MTTIVRSCPPNDRCHLAFIDDPLQSGMLVRGSHVGQLRQAIDAVRTTAGLPLAWGSYTPATGFIYAAHIIELRNKLNEARALLNLPPVAFSDSNLTPGDWIRDEDITELRNGVK